MKIFEIETEPRVELDLPNKVYIVYDENGKEYSRHPFKEVWDSSPAKRAAQQDYGNVKIELKKAKDKAAEGAPLSKYEQEYTDIHAKWKQYYQTVFPRDKAPSILDSETKKVYLDQMDKWMTRLEQLNQFVRRSVILGTYKPSD
jgi:hypothetical protein